MTQESPKNTTKFGKGNPGKPKGAVNKTTREFRETVTKLLSDNADNVALWLEQVAMGVADQKPDPGKALELMAKLAEYAAPKLGRVEVDANINGSVSIVDAVRAFHERRTSDSDVQG